ncbi:MAG TPA: hypothetical protein VH092_02675 [Urbifossiella sp.]|nr:hypothetical protein [Urbifossiella sp.]
MPRKTATDLARAAARQRGEARLLGEPLVPLASFARLPLDLGGDVVYPTAAVLLRWARDGRRGAFLDAVLCPQTLTWVTSRPTLERFVREYASGPGGGYHVDPPGGRAWQPNPPGPPSLGGKGGDEMGCWPAPTEADTTSPEGTEIEHSSPSGGRGRGRG